MSYVIKKRENDIITLCVLSADAEKPRGSL